MAIDPVCGMTVDEKKAAGVSTYKDKTYYFCSRGCKVQFDKDPEKWVNANPNERHMPGMGKH